MNTSLDEIDTLASNYDARRMQIWQLAWLLATWRMAGAAHRRGRITTTSTNTYDEQAFRDSGCPRQFGIPIAIIRDSDGGIG